MLTEIQSGKFNTSGNFGSFFCTIENFGNFSILERNFKTFSDAINIPFSCNETRVEMIFSLNGHSVFNSKSNPMMLSPKSHCINLFKSYNCQNLLHSNAQQSDIAIRLGKGFYYDLISNHLSLTEDRLPEMIYNQKEFNTINQHLPVDAGILGILKNIKDCPFEGSMRLAFLREHIRALLTLQLFHFNSVVGGKKVQVDNKISKRDKDVLHEVKKYLDEHFLDTASLDMLSRNFGLNDFKLKHGFKVLFQTSPIRYLQQKRLEYSLFLLRETDMTIKKIAAEIGYSHAANFTTAFTKNFGNPPQHYRPHRDVYAPIIAAKEVVA